MHARSKCGRLPAYGPGPTSAGVVRLGTAWLPSGGGPPWRVHCPPRGRWPGHAFSGPRSRGAGSGSRTLPRQHPSRTPAARRPRMGPAPACPGHLPCHHRGLAAVTPPRVDAGRRWRLRAQAPFAVASGPAGHAGVDATGSRTLRWSPASVGRSTQATPPPYRSGRSRVLSAQRMTAKGRQPQLVFNCPAVDRQPA